MKRKQIICYGATAALTAVNVLGCNPFLPAVVAMIASENVPKWLVMLSLFGGCAFFMPYIMAVKYIVICGLIIIGEVLLKKYYGHVGVIGTGCVTSGCVFLTGLAGEAFELSRYGILVIGLETAFSFGMVLTFKRLLHRFLMEKQKLLKRAEVPEVEKSNRLHGYVRALHKMADSFGGRQMAYVSGGLGEEAKTLQKGLNAIAAAIEECNSKPVYECLDQEEEIRQMEYELSEKGIESWQYSMYMDGDGHHVLQFDVRAFEHQGMTLRKIAGIAGNIFGMRFAPVEQGGSYVGKNKQRVVLKEVGRFQVKFHVAKESRQQGEICGDNFSFLRQEEGKTMIALSDGMGCGQTACRQSETVLELIEELVGAGFSPRDALPMINGCLTNQLEDGFMATIDLCEIDEFTGLATFYKMGAPMSFLLRKNQVECIESAALPAGAFSGAEIFPLEKKLYDGDYLVMVSDGVLDSLTKDNPEETMKRVLQVMTHGNPGAMSRRILEIAKEAGGSLSDDAMVLVAGIWER